MTREEALERLDRLPCRIRNVKNHIPNRGTLTDRICEVLEVIADELEEIRKAL